MPNGQLNNELILLDFFLIIEKGTKSYEGNSLRMGDNMLL